MEEVAEEFLDDQTDSDPTLIDKDETPFTDAMGSLNTNYDTDGSPYSNIPGVCDSRTWW